MKNLLSPRLRNVRLVYLLVVLGLLVGCGCDYTDSSGTPSIGSERWYQEVSDRTGVIDADGHGPDVGSQEWLEAVSRKVEVYDAMGHGPDLGCDEWKSCVHRKVFGIE